MALEETLAKPIESVLFHLGRGIAQAQMELDRNSIATQILINNNPELRDMGLEATWYQIPEVLLELKLSVHIVEEVKNSIKRKRIFIAPLNATYKNTLNYEVKGSSSIKLKIVPVPPPAGVELSNV